MPISFRGHYLLCWDHHQVLLHPRMNICIDSLRGPLPPPQLTPMFSVKVPFQKRICRVWLSVPTGCQEQRASHSESPQTDDKKASSTSSCLNPKSQGQFSFVFSKKLLGQKPLCMTITRFPGGYYLLSGL